MADVIETPLRLFCELAQDNTLAGHYQLEFQRRVEVGGVEIVPAAVLVKDLTPEEAAAIINTDSARVVADNQAMHAQIDGFRADIADLSARLGNALQALAAVSAADRSWDSDVRAKVVAVQEAEAAR